MSSATTAVPKASQKQVSRRDASVLDVLAALSPAEPMLQEASLKEKNEMTPDHVNPIQWQQASAIARQSCARFFRDGGTPADAMRAFGLEPQAPGAAQWDKAVDAIAQSLCSAPVRRAA